MVEFTKRGKGQRFAPHLVPRVGPLGLGPVLGGELPSGYSIKQIGTDPEAYDSRGRKCGAIRFALTTPDGTVVPCYCLVGYGAICQDFSRNIIKS